MNRTVYLSKHPVATVGRHKYHPFGGYPNAHNPLPCPCGRSNPLRVEVGGWANEARYEVRKRNPCANRRSALLYTILAVLFIFVGLLAAMVVEAGLGREIEWVGTYLSVAALLGMFVRTFGAFAVYVLLLWVASIRSSLMRFTGMTAMMQQPKLAR
jgi:uncharacterized membrane protein YdbT with pleckstrin-like domain